MPLISHRGAAHLAEANTLEAIKKGDEYSPSFVEIDINASSDGVYVILHGAMSRFLTGKKMKSDLIGLKGSNPGLLTLDQLSSITIRSAYMFDIKVADKTSLLQIIEKLSTLPRDDFAFTSPHERSLIAMKHAFPKSAIFQSQPYYLGPLPAFDIARRNGFEGVALNKWWLIPLVRVLCKVYNKKLMCYTIDSKIGIRLAQFFFPDAYIVTNRPDIYRSVYPVDKTT